VEERKPKSILRERESNTCGVRERSVSVFGFWGRRRQKAIMEGDEIKRKAITREKKKRKHNFFF
jgi:hypothetical protein